MKPTDADKRAVKAAAVTTKSAKTNTRNAEVVALGKSQPTARSVARKARGLNPPKPKKPAPPKNPGRDDGRHPYA